MAAAPLFSERTPQLDTCGYYPLNNRRMHSKRGRARRSRRREECPVCLEALSERQMEGVKDDALACPRGHNVCARCVGRLARPTGRCGPGCSGLNFVCPLCRSVACVSNLHMLVLIKGSWRAAVGEFSGCRECDAWSRGDQADDSSSTASTESATEEEEEDGGGEEEA